MNLCSPICMLSFIAFFPIMGVLGLLLFPRENVKSIKWFTLMVTAILFAATVAMAIPGVTNEGDARFEIGQKEMQNTFFVSWIPELDINYAMGVDGISLPLILLTALVFLLSMGASWKIEKQVKGYCIMYLILLTGVLGVFLSLDLFLFYVFWEIMLVPMYFLIGNWGGPRRLYAATKFFLFTLIGGVLMLIGMLMLYFGSNLGDEQLTPRMLADAHVIQTEAGTPQQLKSAAQELRAQIAAGERTEHTFNILALQQIGQHTDQFEVEVLLGKSISWWAFLLLLLGFVVKVPSVPMHTWLPDAHVEAPTPISMILAGVLLKLGGYGILRICYPICPSGGHDLAYLVCTLGVVSMVYGGFAAMAAKDFKRLVAYSSVSHMGYVILGIGVWSASSASTWGVTGAMYQMIAHGISSVGMFFMVGVIYDRVHHRDLDQFGGIFSKMPVYGGLSFGIFFAGMGLPGLCGFIGEVFVTFAVWEYSKVLAVVSAAVVLITAGYILWTLQRVFLGEEYKGPHPENLSRITPRELTIAIPIMIMAVVLGVYPTVVLKYTQPSIELMVDDNANWSEKNRPNVLQDSDQGEQVVEEEAADSGA